MGVAVASVRRDIKVHRRGRLGRLGECRIGVQQSPGRWHPPQTRVASASAPPALHPGSRFGFLGRQSIRQFAGSRRGGWFLVAQARLPVRFCQPSLNCRQAKAAETAQASVPVLLVVPRQRVPYTRRLSLRGAENDAEQRTQRYARWSLAAAGLLAAVVAGVYLRNVWVARRRRRKRRRPCRLRSSSSRTSFRTPKSRGRGRFTR